MVKGKKISSGTKQSKTKKAISTFKMWNDNRYTLYNSKGESFDFPEDEIFVPVYDYRKGHGKIDKNYYVSNKGNVLSFKFYGTDKPIVMVQVPKDEYLVTGNGWRVHKLVWFSFVADTLENGNDYNIDYFGVDITSLKKLSDIEVHHKNTIASDNVLSNLKVLPDEVHVVLTKMKNASSEEDRWNLFLEKNNIISKYTDEAYAVFTEEDDTDISNLDQEDIEKINGSSAIQNFRWQMFYSFVIQKVVYAVGRDFFDKERITACYFSDTNVFQIVKLKNNEEGVAVYILSENDDRNNQDIIVNDWNIYLPNYQMDEEIEE